MTYLLLIIAVALAFFLWRRSRKVKKHIYEDRDFVKASNFLARLHLGIKRGEAKVSEPEEMTVNKHPEVFVTGEYLDTVFHVSYIKKSKTHWVLLKERGAAWVFEREFKKGKPETLVKHLEKLLNPASEEILTEPESEEKESVLSEEQKPAEPEEFLVEEAS